MKKRVILKFVIAGKNPLVLSKNWEYEILPIGTKFSVWEITGEVVSLDYRQDDHCILDIVVQIEKSILKEDTFQMEQRMARYGFH